MKVKRSFFHKKLTDNQNYNILGLIISLILLVILIRLPEPGTFSGQNWRVEFLLSIFLLLLFGLILHKNKFDFSSLKIQSKYFKPIIYLLSLFIIWGGFSIIWAESWRAVVYHSLSWSVYLLIFIFLISYLQKTKNYKPLFTVFIFLSLILFINNAVDLLTIEALKTDVKYPRIRYAKFAEMLVTFAPLLWIVSIYWKKGENYFFFLILGAVTWIGVMLSLSKGAFIAGIFSFLFCFAAVFLFSKKKFRKRLLFSAFIWILLTVSHQFIFSNFSNIQSTANFVSGAAEKERETTSFRIFTWKVSGVMITDNLLMGVGANNYGIAFNDYRIEFAKLFPQDAGHTTAEDHLVERAHNEYLQVFAELGIVGGSIFLLFFLLFAVWTFKSFAKNKFRASPIFFGSLAGISAFLISSISSSFSFRLMQNGVVFLMILTIFVYELNKIDKKTKETEPENSSFKLSFNKLVFASAFLILILMTLFSSITAVSNFYIYSAENEPDLGMAVNYFDKSLKLNPENASAYFSKGIRLYGEKQMDESADNLQKAINLGLGTVISYSYLAEAYEKSGNIDSAEKTLAESVNIFPHSVFSRVRYSIILEKSGKASAAKKQMEIAKAFDEKHTKGWYNLIKYGSKRAFAMYKENEEEIAQPAALRPRDANLQFLDKIKLPQTARNKNFDR